MGDVQERVAATADPADALGVGVVVLGVRELRQRFLQLVPVTEDRRRHATASLWSMPLICTKFTLSYCANDRSEAKTRSI